jgi:hypothetical protein
MDVIKAYVGFSRAGLARTPSTRGRMALASALASFLLGWVTRGEHVEVHRDAVDGFGRTRPA